MTTANDSATAAPHCGGQYVQQPERGEHQHNLDSFIGVHGPAGGMGRESWRTALRHSAFLLRNWLKR